MIIGLSGKIGSGKDTVAGMLPERFQNKKYADILKTMTAVMLGCCKCDLEDRDFKELKLHGLPLTVREIMQKLGTEFGRDMVHPDTWVKLTLKDYQVGRQWVISDVRFPNEAKAIKELGGIVVRVKRPIFARTGYMDLDDMLVNASEKELEKLHHISETALDDWDFDHTIYNASSLENLEKEVNQLITKYNLQ